MHDLRFAVSDVAGQPGALRHVECEALVEGLAAGGTRVPEGATIELDLRLEGVPEGVVVLGQVGGHWEAECSRCLEPVVGPFSVEAAELFEDEPVESETYLLDGDEIDLEPLVRDLVVLELPGAPLCDDDCRGLCPECGANRNEVTCACVTDDRDPRWAVLDELRLADAAPPASGADATADDEKRRS